MPYTTQGVTREIFYSGSSCYKRTDKKKNKFDRSHNFARFPFSPINDDRTGIKHKSESNYMSQYDGSGSQLLHPIRKRDVSRAKSREVGRVSHIAR